MQVIIVGTGKLATELLNSLQTGQACPVVPWANRQPDQPGIVVHAGSGRELEAACAYCAATQSPLIELSTGSAIEQTTPTFPVIVCPNTNILMLKFMSMLAQCGPMFHGQNIQLLESHQAQKTSVPGTAVSMAQSLGLPASAIQSIRDPHTQHTELRIPEASLGRHAYHQIRIEDGDCSITLETRVFGETPYASGVAQIIAAIRAHTLENRIYPIMAFVQNGWL